MKQNKKNVLTLKQKNVTTEKHYDENVFKNLKKSFENSNKIYNINLDQKENSESVSTGKKRQFRISTYVTDEIGDLIDEIIVKIKKQEGKKPKIAEILERAIITLNNKLH